MPGDFREYFDLRKLDDRQRGEIEFVLNSPAYQHSFKPYIQGILHGLLVLAEDRGQLRKDQYPDDFIFGGRALGNGLLKFFDLLIDETNLERIHAAMSEMTPDMLYDKKREAGQMRPVVGLDQPADPQPPPPDEDY